MTSRSDLLALSTATDAQVWAALPEAQKDRVRAHADKLGTTVQDQRVRQAARARLRSLVKSRLHREAMPSLPVSWTAGAREITVTRVATDKDSPVVDVWLTAEGISDGHLRFVNAPTLVSDAAGDVVLTDTDPVTGEATETRWRHDPRAALRRAITETVQAQVQR